MLNRPHRACPGGAWVSAQERRRPLFSAPTGLAPVERGFLHKRGLAESLAPTGLAPVERRLLLQRSGFLVFKPPLHRRARWGRLAVQALLCRNPRSTGASPGGAADEASHALVHKPTLHRDKPGGGVGRASPLVQKPSLHRGKLGGGGAQAGLGYSPPLAV